jgi:hypothetical protein
MNLDSLSATMSVLSAMITPAVLISACGSLLIATSNRLGRVIDRTRYLSDRFHDLAHDTDRTLVDEERAMLFEQLNRATRRSRLLQQAMTRLYQSLSVFVATSVAIGVVAMVAPDWAVVPLALGVGGAGLLFHASLLLIGESRVALHAIYDEMAFVQQLGDFYAPAELIERRDDPKRRFRHRTRRE